MRILVLKKMGFRLLLVTVLLVVVKLLIDSDYNDDFFTATTSFYYGSGVVFFIACWEISDWLIKKHLQQDALNGLDWISGLRILGTTILMVMPLFAFSYYFAIFRFSDIIELDSPNLWLQFRMDFSRALIIAITIILFNLFYFAGMVKNKLQTRLLALEKEMIASKYKSLQSQLSPHFLFNSLNTLTSLMYADRDLASDFTARLAACYRYILDHSDKDLIHLDKELSFLDSFIFMMEVRHTTSLEIRTQINLDPHEYVIPTLCLQMLVENALKHNYFSIERPLLLTISNDEKYLTVSNTLRKRTDSETSTQLGLENIGKRYSYYTSAPVKIIQEEDLFVVRVPLLKKNIEQLTTIQTSL